MGSINSSRFLKMGPCIRSTFMLKGDFFAVWVIRFLTVYGKQPSPALHSKNGEGRALFFFYSSWVSKPWPVSTSTLVKPAALMAAAASSKPKVRLEASWESEVMMTLPPILFHSSSIHALG